MYRTYASVRYLIDVIRGTPEALVAALERMGLIPDGMGELYLYPAQARAIRTAGYSAVGNRMWMCPILPDSLVSNTPYAHLSDALPRRYGHQPGEWRPYRSHVHGDPRGGYVAVFNARTPTGERAYCPLCKRAHVHEAANADVHTHTEHVLSDVRKQLAAVAAVIGMALVPVNNQPQRR